MRQQQLLEFLVIRAQLFPFDPLALVAFSLLVIVYAIRILQALSPLRIDGMLSVT